MTLAAGTPIGKYVVRRKLAEGGMAEIYLAAALGPEGFEKDVVIKRVRPGLAGDPDFVRMFIAEARVASRLNHANLVHIFDFDKHEDTYYLAMEYVRGHSLWELRRRCQERGVAIPPILVAQIGMEVARGLAYAHRLTENGQSLGLVHRDVTPHNVLLSFDGAVKLTDFGIAKAGGRATTSGMLKGKFAYMSPEQARGDAVDARTDVFALGVTLWELLTGARLFEGEGDVAVLRAVQERLIVPPARLNPAVAAPLDAAVMRALERDRGRRWPTAHELERALAEVLLAGARSLEDTDVGAFLRRMFPEEAGVAEPAAGTASIPISLSISGPPGVAAAEPARGASVVQPTELVTPAPLEPAPTEVLPGARPRVRWPALLLAVGAIAAVMALAVRAGPGLVARWRDRSPVGSTARNAQPRPESSGPARAPGPAAADSSVAMTGAATAEPVPRESTARPASPAPATPAPTPATVAAAERDGTSRSRGGAPGAAVVRARLVIRAKPWAELRVDGKRAGYVQGSKTVRLPAGRHLVELTGPDGVAGTYTVQLVQGRTATLEHPPGDR
ncbi:MAG TPA: protein kinase [Myxococcaceae bacterium]|nr:protein kinase [Myxococcaceae bacterium]